MASKENSLMNEGMLWNVWAELYCSENSDSDEESKEKVKIKEEAKESGATKLRQQDMATYDLCPLQNNFFLVVCELCGYVTKPQGLKKHIDMKHPVNTSTKEKAPLIIPVSNSEASSNCTESQPSKQPTVNEIKPILVSDLYSKANNSPVTLYSQLTDSVKSAKKKITPNPVFQLNANSDFNQPVKNSVSDYQSAKKNNFVPTIPIQKDATVLLSANGVPVSLIPWATSILPTNLPISEKFIRSSKVSCKYRQYDPDLHCGVSEINNKPCKRSMGVCKDHPIALQRGVVGRSKPFDELLLEHKAAKRSLKLAKQNSINQEKKPITVRLIPSAGVSTTNIRTTTTTSAYTTVPTIWTITTTTSGPMITPIKSSDTNSTKTSARTTESSTRTSKSTPKATVTSSKTNTSSKTTTSAASTSGILFMSTTTTSTITTTSNTPTTTSPPTSVNTTSIMTPFNLSTKQPNSMEPKVIQMCTVRPAIGTLPRLLTPPELTNSSEPKKATLIRHGEALPIGPASIVPDRPGFLPPKHSGLTPKYTGLTPKKSSLTPNHSGLTLKNSGSTSKRPSSLTPGGSGSKTFLSDRLGSATPIKYNSTNSSFRLVQEVSEKDSFRPEKRIPINTGQIFRIRPKQKDPGKHIERTPVPPNEKIPIKPLHRIPLKPRKTVPLKCRRTVTINFEQMLTENQELVDPVKKEQNYSTKFQDSSNDCIPSSGLTSKPVITRITPESVLTEDLPDPPFVSRPPRPTAVCTFGIKQHKGVLICNQQANKLRLSLESLLEVESPKHQPHKKPCVEPSVQPQAEPVKVSDIASTVCAEVKPPSPLPAVQPQSTIQSEAALIPNMLSPPNITSGHISKVDLVNVPNGVNSTTAVMNCNENSTLPLSLSFPFIVNDQMEAQLSFHRQMIYGSSNANVTNGVHSFTMDNHLASDLNGSCIQKQPLDLRNSRVTVNCGKNNYSISSILSNTQSSQNHKSEDAVVTSWSPKKNRVRKNPYSTSYKNSENSNSAMKLLNNVNSSSCNSTSSSDISLLPVPQFPFVFHNEAFFNTPGSTGSRAGSVSGVHQRPMHFTEAPFFN